MKNKHFLQFVAILLCTTLLTFSVGRVTRVKAVVTEAAIATGVAIIVGTAFLGYLALTGANVRYDNADTLNDYVADVGNWVMEYGSGVGLTRLIAQASDWVGRQALSAFDFTVEYTSDLISDFYNAFNNTDVIKKAIAVSIPPSLTVPTLNFNFPPIVNSSDLSYVYHPSTGYDYTYSILSGFSQYLLMTGNSDSASSRLIQAPYTNLVNYQTLGSSRFRVGKLVGNSITPVPVIDWATPIVIFTQGVFAGYTHYTYYDSAYRPYGVLRSYLTSVDGYSDYFPLIGNKPLYLVDSTGQIISTTSDVVSTSSTSVSFPNQGGDDDDKNPIIPFVPFPSSPVNPNGFWGSLVDDILDAILDVLDSAIIASLIDDFADANGGDSIFYDDDAINYYYYYDITNNITQQSEELPIDLNEISLYTDNRYLTTLSDSVHSVSDVLHDYAGFWYDVDPTVVFVILGSAVLSVVALLLHKMGG